MVVGSFAFSGENCKVSLMAEGAAGSVDVSGRLVGGNITGFALQSSQEQTLGGYFNSFNGYSPASVQLSFLYDQEDDLSPMISYLGSTVNTSGQLHKTLLTRTTSSPTYYKIKFEFNEYTGTFDSLGTSDRVLRIIFYNAFGVNTSTAATADGTVAGNITFNVSPFSILGSSNYLELEKGSGDSVSSLDSLESGYDSDMGY